MSRRRREAPLTTVRGPVPTKRQDDNSPVLDARSVAPAWGWKHPGGGRASHVQAAPEWEGTTTQICGLYPFVAGSGAPSAGVPIGQHMHWGQLVSLDPFAWLERGIVTNPGVWIQGQTGIGKSSIARRLMEGMIAFGIHCVVLGDIKPDYAGLVSAMGGQVISVGRGRDRINPLDAGPLGSAIKRLRAAGMNDRADGVAAELRGRRLALLCALCAIGRRDAVTPGEELVLGAALDHLTDELGEGVDPTVRQVHEVLREAPPAVVDAAEITLSTFDDVTEAQASELAWRSRNEFLAETKHLRQALRLMLDGTLRGLFDGPSSVAIDLDAPAVDIDLSPIANGSEDALVASAMFCVWSFGFAAIDASLVLADAGLIERRNYCAFMDELWKALRVASGLVERADVMTRVNRQLGGSQVMITHTLRDMESLPNAEDRAKAMGFPERCAIRVLGGLPPRELRQLSNVIGQLSAEEIRLVSSWSQPDSWEGTGVHPGRGKYLVKVGDGAGIPVRMGDFVPAEKEYHDTDWRAVATIRQRQNRGAEA